MAGRCSSKLSENWQEGKTIPQCNLFLLENNFSDVTFRLHYKDDNKKKQVADIPALRVFCLARSPVFFAMFAGELAQQLDNPIHDIHDDHADPEAFKMMVRFMYSDDVTLTADNVLAVMYLSQKYIITSLTKRCLQFLEENLTPDTAPVLLEQSMLYEEKELKEKTLATIQEEAPAVLASEEFLDVSKEVLGEVLKLNLRVEKEVTVFDACMKWAKKQCQKLKKTSSGENIREVLGSHLFQIRFPTMSLSEFTEIVAPTDVLTHTEGYQVMRYITSESNKPWNLPFPTEQRKEIDLNPRSLLVPASYYQMNGRLDGGFLHNRVTSLSCSISKPVRLHRLFVSAPDYPFKFELTVTLLQNGKCLLYGTPSCTTRQLPQHFAVDVNDVRVESGAMELIINLKLIATFQCGCYAHYTINCAPQGISQLSDDYVTITFPPVNDNLLLGLVYRIP